MTLLLDAHRPRSLDRLDYHPSLSSKLTSLAASPDFPHTLFYGPSGAGKKTRILCLLKEIYGPGVEKLRVDQRTFVTPSRRKLEVNIVQSNFHIELTPSDVGNYDRAIIQEVLKEIAQSQQIDLHARQRFKVVVINEADLLSRDAQSALRRTMEKYSANLRIILCANGTGRIIAPIRSRCLLLRVGAPTNDEIVQVLSSTLKADRRSALPEKTLNSIAELSQGNLRRALLALEAHLASGAAGGDEIPKPDWEAYVDKAAGSITSKQSPDQVVVVRAMLYELIVHCIPPSLILSAITKSLLQKLPRSSAEDERLAEEVVGWAAHYEHRLRCGSKAIFHLEAYVVRLMSVLKNKQQGLGVISTY